MPFRSRDLHAARPLFSRSEPAEEVFGGETGSFNDGCHFKLQKSAHSTLQGKAAFHGNQATCLEEVSAAEAHHAVGPRSCSCPRPRARRAWEYDPGPRGGPPPCWALGLGGRRRTQTHTRTHAHTRAHTHTHTRAHTHTHTHTPGCSRSTQLLLPNRPRGHPRPPPLQLDTPASEETPPCPQATLYYSCPPGARPLPTAAQPTPCLLQNLQGQELLFPKWLQKSPCVVGPSPLSTQARPGTACFLGAWAVPARTPAPAA